LPGAFAKLRNATDEVTGAFAEGLAPVVQRVATLLANKMANPAFVARVRELGRLVGEKLVQAFVAVSTWFGAHWGQIQGGFRTFSTIIQTVAKHAGTLKSVLVTITKPLQIQLKILLAIWDKVLAAVSTGAGLLSHVPGVGGKFKGVQGAADAARETLKHPLGPATKQPGVGKKGGRLRGLPRQHGGPVYPGGTYTVGERGPEMLTMGKGSGYVTPNGGGGGGGDLVLAIDGRELGRVALSQIQRLGKNSAGQTRGRHGGSKLALG
jgi:hypothetical protein